MKTHNNTSIHLENPITDNPHNTTKHLAPTIRELAQPNITATLTSSITPNPEHLLKQVFQNLRASLANEASTSRNIHLQALDVLENREFKPRPGGIQIANSGAALGGRRSSSNDHINQIRTLQTHLTNIDSEINRISWKITVIQEDMSYTQEGSDEQQSLQNELAPLEANLERLTQFRQETTNQINQLRRQALNQHHS